MSLSDPFADFLTRLRNACSAKLRYVDINSSKLIMEVVQLLKRDGFIKDFVTIPETDGRKARIYLRYDRNRRPLLQKAVRISRPGRRHYVRADQIRPIQGGIGRNILTTNQGVMTGQEAKKANVGGELLCYFA